MLHYRLRPSATPRVGRYVMTGRRYEAVRAQPCSVAVAQLGQLSNSAAILALRSSPLIRPLCCW